MNKRGEPIIYKELLAENNKRKATYYRKYSRIIGDTHSESVNRFMTLVDGQSMYLPKTMEYTDIYKTLKTYPTIKELLIATGGYSKEKESALARLFIKERFAHDFEFWAYSCVKIQDKISKRLIRFELNEGQRVLLRAYEEQRLEGVPIRTVLVKARQWGGSTLTQMYMLWLQLFHYENWHSVIIAHLKDVSVRIRSMMTKTLARYPKEFGEYTFSPILGSVTSRYIPQRGCEISIGTAEEPESVRSSDNSMAHLSECASWPQTATKSGDDLVQAIYATIPDAPGTFICFESTAKGIGNFFHEQYLGAISGTSQFKMVFVPWFFIDIYQRKIPEMLKFVQSMTPYEWWQWKQGATLEGIYWYRSYKAWKRYTDFQMRSEFPTTADEAFQTKSGKYFTLEEIETARRGVAEPKFTGDIRGDSLVGEDSLRGINLVSDGTGAYNELRIWEMPETIESEIITDRYIVILDIGGRSHTSDKSVITVLDRAALIDPFGALEVVAEWRGNEDYDIIAWKAAQVATFYHNALLVIESNTLETKAKKHIEIVTYEGDHFYTVLEEIKESYGNLYSRSSTPDQVKEKESVKYGWHMNRKSKYQAYDRYSKALREGEFVERSQYAINEMEWLLRTPDGKIEAIAGKNDDIMDTRAIGVYVALEQMPMPKIMTITKEKKSVKQRGAVASI